MRVKLPSGRTVNVEQFDDSYLLVSFTDEVEHKLLVSINLTPEEVDMKIHDYLYGYTDENGEHVPGYFELIKEMKEKKESKAWWQS